jgi:hypothetical protein
MNGRKEEQEISNFSDTKKTRRSNVFSDKIRLSKLLPTSS